MGHLNLRSLRALRITIAALAVGAATCAFAAEDDIAICNQAASNPDQGIPACTRLLSRKDIGLDAVFLNRARGHTANGSLDSAIDDYNSAINNNPKNVQALRNRGVLWYRKAEFDRAFADFTKIIALDPKSPTGFSYRAIALIEKGEYDRAISDLNQSIRIDPKNSESFRFRGLAFSRKRELARSLSDYDQAIKLNPKDAAAFNARAEVWIIKEEYDRAIADYDQVIALDPNGWRGYSSRGEAKRSKGDLTAALADHDAAVKLDPKAYDALVNRALASKEAGKLDSALEDLNEALLINSRSGHALALRGEIFRATGQFGKAKSDLESAIKLFPNSAMIHCRLGDTLRDIGTLDQALREYEKAMLAAPGSVCSFVGRGFVQEKKGALDAARADYVKAAAMPAEEDIDPINARESKEIAKNRIVAVDRLLADRKANERPTDDPAAAQRLAELEARTKQLQERLQQEQARVQQEQERKKKDETAAVVNQGVRVALVIGNSKYESVGELPNPKGDADAVAAALTKIGFQKVILRHDLGRQSLLAALREFEEAADKADWAVIYYAGHGIELGGLNYVIPVDARLRADRDVSDESIPLERVMSSVQRTRKLRLVILDACRDNPFLSKMQRVMASRSIGRGLADVEPEGGILVAFAAKGGQTASDGDAGQRSPYVKAFLQHLQTPQLEIGLLFRRVRDDVLKATGKKQEPFIYGSLPGENFFFVAK
ncbi:MAG: caspase family protein [Pseudorhodoplanes sp.]